MTRLYAHGLPFSEVLAVNLDDIGERVQKRKASLIIIDGGIGEGKTTLAVHIADYYNQRPIVFEDQLSMGGSQFLQRLRLCYERKLPVVVYDEAGDFNRRGALTRFNAMLNRTFETFRGLQVIVIIVLPSFHVLDGDLFDKDIPRLLLHCENRNEHQGNFKAYSLYRMLYVRHRMKNLVVKSFAYNLVQPNFYGHFLDLPRDRSRALDRFSTAGKIRELEASEVRIDGLVSYRDIATKLSRSVVWVRKKVGDLKINPERVIRQRKYFSGDVIDRLADLIDDLQAKKEAGKLEV